MNSLHTTSSYAITRAQKELKIYWTPEVEKKVLQRIRPRNIDADVEILREFITPQPYIDCDLAFF